MDATHVFRDRGGMFDVEWKQPAIAYEAQFNKKGEPKLDTEGNPIVIERALWPAVWNLKALAKKCAEIGLRAFTQQYLLRVQSDEDLTFKPEDLQPSYDSMLWRLGQYLPIEGLEGMIPDSWPTFGGVDLASTAGTKSAYTVIFTLARNPDNKRLYFKDIVRKKMAWPQLLKEMQLAFDKHHWQHCFVEDNQFQRVVVQELDENHKHMPVSGVHTGINKQDPKVGLPGMSTAFSKSLFVIPARDVEKMTEGDTTPLGIFWNELSNHPGAKNSDTIMALWLAYRCYLTHGVNSVEGFNNAVAAS
jgi:phage terminase large subunit-like protein